MNKDDGGHVEHVCTKSHDDGRSCMFCDGGLFACDVCGAFEGATPDECPGREMTGEEAGQVYRGLLNYRDGAWREECCAVMRPIYDKTAYMAERGYVHVETAYGGSWVKTTAPEAASDAP